VNYEIATLTPFARNDKKGESLRGNKVAEAIPSVPLSLRGAERRSNPIFIAYEK